MAPASLQLTLFEPVVFLRGQSAVGEDARGRRRPINFDAPPSQLRGLLIMNLPKSSKINEISILLQGRARTDWPEGEWGAGAQSPEKWGLTQGVQASDPIAWICQRSPSSFHKRLSSFQQTMRSQVSLGDGPAALEQWVYWPTRPERTGDEWTAASTRPCPRRPLPAQRSTRESAMPRWPDHWAKRLRGQGRRSYRQRSSGS